MDLNPSSGPKLSPNERKIVDYLSGIAAETPDRRVSKSIREIAEATGLAQRTVQPILQKLNREGVIRILSKGKEKTLIEVRLEYSSSPAEPVVEQPVNPELAVPPPASISELIFRMTDKQPTAEDIRELKAAVAAAVGTDKEEELMKVLDFLWRRDSRFDGFELLTVGVVHQLLVREKPYEYR